MSRINTNIQSLVAQRYLTANKQSLETSLQRLSTGLRINSGKDDPAGLIASENLRAEKSGLSAAIDNADRADQVVNIAEGGLQEVSNLLTDLQGLVTSTANSGALSDDEKKANQDQIDSILQTIDRISNGTSFQGSKLLNGHFDYNTSNIDAGVSDFKVNSAKLTNGQSLAVQAIVTASAQQAGLYLSTNGAVNLGGAVGSTFSIEISGSLGSREFQFGSGTALTDIQTAINTYSNVTGVTATVSGTGVKLASTDYGSKQFVSVKVLDDANIQGTGIGIFGLTSNDFNTANTGAQTAFTSAANGVRDNGQDIAATINGVQANGNGRKASINTDFLNVDITFSNSGSNNAAQTIGAVNAFTVNDGGADFQLGGHVDISSKVSLGISDISTRKLGNSTAGYLSELGSKGAFNVQDGDLVGAQGAISEAIKQVSETRGRLGALQKNTIGATLQSLGVSLENTTAAESQIRDADFAAETANLTRNQILVNAATNALSLANSAPQAVLRLLQ